jgi:hypothetical protein
MLYLENFKTKLQSVIGGLVWGAKSRCEVVALRGAVVRVENVEEVAIAVVEHAAPNLAEADALPIRVRIAGASTADSNWAGIPCAGCAPRHASHVVDVLQQPCDKGVFKLGFVVLEKCLEIITPWVEDDLAPAFLLLELSLICSDKMKASAAEFFNRPADFVPTEVREDVQCRQPCSRTLFDLEALLKVLPRLWDASSLVVDPFEAVFEAKHFSGMGLSRGTFFPSLFRISGE